MTRIDALLAAGRTTSFEFFPPRTSEAAERLHTTLRELEPLAPSFVSVTYGAGGSTRETTRAVIEELLQTTSLTPMAHLTLVSHTREELTSILTHYRDVGVENLMLLRGDPPASADEVFWELDHAVELVELARDVGGDQFSIGVAAHPEGHPQSPDLETDRDHLAAKLEAADFAVTQFFFDVADYRRMVDDLATRGCDRPVIPGIMPVTNVSQITRFAELSGAAFPPELADRLAAAENPAEVRRIGVEVATELCQALLDDGAPGLHFYTLNHSTATREIHARLFPSAVTTD
ncbi:MAG: methylenetetrahydrofolate reductase [NAD(P)H] [Nitriliruptoraceae bacterium]